MTPRAGVDYSAADRFYACGGAEVAAPRRMPAVSPNVRNTTVAAAEKDPREGYRNVPEEDRIAAKRFFDRTAIHLLGFHDTGASRLPCATWRTTV